MEYYNGPDLSLDFGVMDRAVHAIHDSGFVTVPFVFEDADSGGRGA